MGILEGGSEDQAWSQGKVSLTRRVVMKRYYKHYRMNYEKRRWSLTTTKTLTSTKEWSSWTVQLSQTKEIWSIGQHPEVIQSLEWRLRTQEWIPHKHPNTEPREPWETRTEPEQETPRSHRKCSPRTGWLSGYQNPCPTEFRIDQPHNLRLLGG